MDIMKHSPEVAATIHAGTQYYKKALLKNGKSTDDDSRLFQEAMASYAGHRASSWFMALEALTVAADDLDGKSNLVADRIMKFRQGSRLAMEQVTGGNPTANLGWYQDVLRQHLAGKEST